MIPELNNFEIVQDKIQTKVKSDCFNSNRRSQRRPRWGSFLVLIVKNVDKLLHEVERLLFPTSKN